jgi:uncharacterized protein
MSQEHGLPGFRGTVRLFPLPNLVLFPHVGQPLHIFEPRYRQLMADALGDDRLITMALLRPGWEEDYHKDPPLHPMVCVGRVAQEERLPDGRYNLVLQGLCRARVLDELETTKLYRVARVELCPDRIVTSEGLERTLRRDLGLGVAPFFSAHPPATDQLRRLLDSPLPLGSLADIFSFALPLEVEEKQLLLEAVCVEARVQLLLRTLEGRSPPTPKQPPRRECPPEFSSN